MIEKKFEISKHFLPSGDQPNAINNLVKGLEEGKDFSSSSWCYWLR